MYTRSYSLTNQLTFPSSNFEFSLLQQFINLPSWHALPLSIPIFKFLDKIYVLPSRHVTLHTNLQLKQCIRTTFHLQASAEENQFRHQITPEVNKSEPPSRRHVFLGLHSISSTEKIHGIYETLRTLLLIFHVFVQDGEDNKR